MVRYGAVFLLLQVAQIAGAQQLITSEFIREESKIELEFALGQEVRSAIELYRITYATSGVKNEPDTASGLIGIPKSPYGGNYQVIAYQHGTTTGPEDAPSLLGAGSLETRAYAAMGYVVSAADYLGLGVNDAFHPYVHRQTEATAGYDCLRATLQFMDQQLGAETPENIFVSGYSQGGHGAMSLLQYLETEAERSYQPTAVAAMSGPYDLSGTMFHRMVGNDPYLFVSYPIYVLVGYQEVYGYLYDSIEQVFNAPYIPAIEAFYDRQIDFTELTAFVFAQLVADHGEPLTKFLFQDTLLQAMLEDPDHRIRRALRDNDNYNWPLNTPTRLLYCTADDQVPFRNAIVADSIFKEMGITNVSTTDIDPSLAHVACATPALMESLDYFDGFVNSTAAREVTSGRLLRTFPNPASDHVQFVAEPALGRVMNIRLLNSQGRIAGEWQQSGDQTIDMSGLPNGMYILEIVGERMSATSKIVKYQ